MPLLVGIERVLLVGVVVMREVKSGLNKRGRLTNQVSLNIKRELPMPLYDQIEKVMEMTMLVMERRV